MNLTNKYNLPEPVARALSRHDYSRGESHRSVTQLIGSPRIRILYEEYADDITEDVSERVWSLLGTTVHKIFEMEATDNYLPEERMFYDIDGFTVSGAIDIQFLEGDVVVKLIDYKCTSVWSVIYGKPEWADQLNFYAWLVRKTKGFTVKQLEVVTILRDWKKRDSQNKGKDYPNTPCVIVDVPVWSEEKQDAYVAERLRIHCDADFDRLTGGALPDCTPAERWQNPTQYAVKKIKNKTASGGRVLDSMEEAKKYVKENDLDLKVWEIDVRESEPTRCSQGYCGVAHICSQYQAEVWNKKYGDSNGDQEDNTDNTD
jgi:hypothetical protein